MRYLLDTNIISELRKKQPNEKVVQWMNVTSQTQLYISCLTIGEIKVGILKIAKKDKTAGISLSKWLSKLIEDYRDQILEIDLEICEEWAALMSIDGTNAIDSLIAAQSLQHNMTLVTRNTKHYKMFNIKLLNPFE